MKLIRMLVVVGTLWTQPFAMAAESVTVKGVEILGVITSNRDGQGIALVKLGGATKAVRVGEALDAETRLGNVSRNYVEIVVQGKSTKVRVGETFETSGYGAASKGFSVTGGDGIEARDGKVRMSSAYRDYIVKGQLSTVLMQAAAVPHYEAGALAGFKLLNIEPGSVYERAGFRNGDVITAINGNRLTDVGMTIRMLHGMREESRVEVNYLRDGAEQRLEVSVD